MVYCWNRRKTEPKTMCSQIYLVGNRFLDMSGYIMGKSWIYQDNCMDQNISGYRGVYIYQNRSENIWINLNISGYIWIYWDISGYIGIYQDILGYIRIYWAISGYIGIYWDISGYITSVNK